jgi:hypothetical protein
MGGWTGWLDGWWWAVATGWTLVTNQHGSVTHSASTTLHGNAAVVSNPLVNNGPTRRPFKSKLTPCRSWRIGLRHMGVVAKSAGPPPMTSEFDPEAAGGRWGFKPN